MKLLPKFLICLILSLSVFNSCQNAPAEKAENKSNNEADVWTSATTAEPINWSESITIKNSMKEGIPDAKLTFKVWKKAYIVREALECQVLARADFKDYNIPDSAGSACQCWWAGGGADYMLKEAGGSVEVWKRLTDESRNAETPKWLLKKTF